MRLWERGPRENFFFLTKIKKVPANVPGKIKTIFDKSPRDFPGTFPKIGPRDFPEKSQGLCPRERGPRESQGVPGKEVPGSPRDY